MSGSKDCLGWSPAPPHWPHESLVRTARFPSGCPGDPDWLDPWLPAVRTRVLHVLSMVWCLSSSWKAAWGRQWKLKSSCYSSCTFPPQHTGVLPEVTGLGHGRENATPNTNSSRQEFAAYLLNFPGCSSKWSHKACSIDFQNSWLPVCKSWVQSIEKSIWIAVYQRSLLPLIDKDDV